MSVKVSVFSARSNNYHPLVSMHVQRTSWSKQPMKIMWVLNSKFILRLINFNVAESLLREMKLNVYYSLFTNILVQREFCLQKTLKIMMNPCNRSIYADHIEIWIIKMNDKKVSSWSNTILAYSVGRVSHELCGSSAWLGTFGFRPSTLHPNHFL